MGYSTQFAGSFAMDRPLTPEHRMALDDFAEARHEGPGYPGFYCQWVPNQEGTAIEWDGGEKFYAWKAWLGFLISRFLAPWGYKLNGEVEWRGEDAGDVGRIVVEDNVVRVKTGRISFGE